MIYNDPSPINSTMAAGVKGGPERDSQLQGMVYAIGNVTGDINDLLYTVKNLADRLYGSQVETAKESKPSDTYCLMQEMEVAFDVHRQQIAELRRQINRLQGL